MLTGTFSHQHTIQEVWGTEGNEESGAPNTHSQSLYLINLLLSEAADWLAGPLLTHFLRTAPSHKSDPSLGGEAGGRCIVLPVVGC